MDRFLISAFLLLLLGGCCSMQQAEEMVGECNQEIKIVPGPPEEITIISPEIKIPLPPTIQFLEWNEEEIRSDPVGYQVVKNTDLDYLHDYSTGLREYLIKLDLARLRAIEDQRRRTGENP